MVNADADQQRADLAGGTLVLVGEQLADTDVGAAAVVGHDDGVS